MVMSGCRCLGIVDRQRPPISISLCEPVISRIFSANCRMVISCGLPMLVGSTRSDMQQPVDAVDQVVDVAEGAGLRAVAEDRHRLAGERLRHEGGHHPAVAQAHARPVGVEDAHDPGLEPVVAVVGHHHRLGEPLRFVVDPARADRVDVAPVGFRLRVHQRVAVDLGGRGEQDAGAFGLGQAERVVGAQRADLEGLDRQLEIVDRAGGRGEVEDEVDRTVDVVGLARCRARAARSPAGPGGGRCCARRR